MTRIRKKVISLDIDTGSYSSFVDRILSLAQRGESAYVCVANVHMTIEAQDDASFAQVVNQANLVTPDGMPLAKAIQLLYKQKQDRVAGMDLLPSLLQQAELQNIPLFFYGGQQATLDHTNSYLEQHYPKISNKHFYSPPFRALNEQETEEITEKINASGAKIVFVVLGCPKQEKWMAEHVGKINACMIGIGGALPVLIGEQKRAPRWMQKASLEWLYRFFQEPRRLFKRYFYTNTKFLLLLGKAYIGQKFSKKKG